MPFFVWKPKSAVPQEIGRQRWDGRLLGNSSLTLGFSQSKFIKSRLQGGSDSKEKTCFVVNLALNWFLIMKLAYFPKQVEESCDHHVHSISVFKEMTKFGLKSKNSGLLSAWILTLNQCFSDSSVMWVCSFPKLVFLTFLKGEKKKIFEKEHLL